MNSFEMVTDYGLDALAATLHQTAVEKGFWDGEITHDKIGNKLALVHSEVTEVLEAIRKSKGSEAIVEEMADIFIRLLDLYAAMRDENMIDDSFDEVLNKKLNINKERPRLHGNLF
jgi:NTP pyrophosphatase (non-canonical NTP hydrolase)